MTDGNPLPHAKGTNSDPHRAAPRDSLFVLGRMTIEGRAGTHDVRIRNLSATGLMADCPVILAEGQAVMIAIKNIGDVPGTIAWCRAGRIGVALSLAIDPALARKKVGGESLQLPEYLKHRHVPGPAIVRRG